MDIKDRIRQSLESRKTQFLEISHNIHSHPELAFLEFKAVGWLCDALKQAGYSVEEHACDLPTAFIARKGNGSLHIAICAEYDALPEMGHACGHNIIAAAALGAGIILADVIDDLDLTVSVIGTPAEEHGGGKILMLDRGGFDNIHAAMMIHPAPFDIVDPSIIAACDFDVIYKGKEAHASAFPEQGVNAGDALTIAQIAIGLLRQHIRPTDRIHGIITKGGDAPNVIPALTSARYIVRSKTLEELKEIREKVMHCFEAGALATGCEIEIIEKEKPYANMQHDADMALLYQNNAEKLGRTFPSLGVIKERFAGSTDMGNVSLAIPAIHPAIGIDSSTAVNHQPEFAAYCNSESADKAVLDGALAMAWTIVDIARNKQLRSRLIHINAKK
ncbi:MAG: M20 family metallopeptidase [Gammaproteobacteria bacterium]